MEKQQSQARSTAITANKQPFTALHDDAGADDGVTAIGVYRAGVASVETVRIQYPIPRWLAVPHYATWPAEQDDR